VTSPESTRVEPHARASGEKPFTMSAAILPRRVRVASSRSTDPRPTTMSTNSVPSQSPAARRWIGLMRRDHRPARIPTSGPATIPTAAIGHPRQRRAAASASPTIAAASSAHCAAVCTSVVAS
jgi:hypothetical protein